MGNHESLVPDPVPAPVALAICVKVGKEVRQVPTLQIGVPAGLGTLYSVRYEEIRGP